MKDSCSFCPSFKLDSSLFSRVSGQVVLWALPQPQLRIFSKPSSFIHIIKYISNLGAR
jgi:hypothetical protein